MRCRFNCQIYYTIYIIFTEFFKLNVWYYNVTHLYEVDYRLLSHISSYLYEIFMELFLSRQNDQIAPVLDTCGWHCVVTPVSPRIQRLKERLIRYNFTAEWRQVKNHHLPDALSRYPNEKPSEEDEKICKEMSLEINLVVMSNEISYDKNSNMKEILEKDADYILLRDTVENGFSKDKKHCSGESLRCWNVRDDLSVEDGIIFYGNRIVIPRAMMKEVLKRLHSSHQGIERSKQRARQTVFWPGINNDIETTVSACDQCIKHRSTQVREPMIVEDGPHQWVFQEVSADFFNYAGKNFLVYADKLSGWPVVTQTNSMNAKNLCKILRDHFTNLGVPQRMRTDCGPQFTSYTFKKFMEKFNVEHVVSSPHYPQSNGHAEAAVKSMKKLIAKTTTNGNIDNDDFSNGLYWSTEILRERQDIRHQKYYLAIISDPLYRLIEIHSRQNGKILLRI